MSEEEEADFSQKPYVIQTKTKLTSGNFQSLTFKDIVYYSTVKSKSHGYPNILKDSGYVKQVLWFVSCLTITAVFLYNFGTLIDLYYRYDVQVVRKVVYARQLRFPGVTLCNTNPVKRSRLHLSDSVSGVVESIQQSPSDGHRKRRKRGASESYDPCTTDYNSATDSCFWHVNAALDAASALASCASASFGGHLAKVPSQSVKDFLIENNLFDGSDHILIGMNDEEVEMTFEWHDESAVTWDDWQENFPVNDISRNCVIYNNQLTRKWEITSCLSDYKFLCEMDAFGAGDSQCTSGTHGASNSCFWYLGVPRRYEIAQQQCAAYDGRLAVMDTEDTTTFVKTQLSAFISQSFWIGLSDELTEGEFVWVDGNPVSWTDWPVDHTPNTGADCVQYDNGLQQWREVSCWNEAHFICEYVNPTIGDSRCTTTYFNGSCFWGVTSLSTAEKAEDNCGQYGARLAKVHAEEIRIFLRNQNVFSESGEWLVGLSDSSVEGSFVWSDGSPQDWEDWKSDTTNADEKDCVSYVYMADLGYRLQHILCSDYVQYICEYFQGSTETSTETTTETSISSSSTDPDSGSSTQGGNEGNTPIPAHLPWSDLPDRELEREDFKEEADMIEALADEDLDIKKDMGYTLDELVLECEFDQKACYRNFGYFYDNKYGNCFVFNALTVDEEYIMSSIQGDDHGLSLVVHINQAEYVEGISKAAGAIVVIHPQSQMPFIEDYGILAKPGHVANIGLKRLSDIKLGGKHSECSDSPEENLTNNVFEEQYNVNYSLTACYKTCYQRHVIETCGCADPMYPMRGVAFGGFSGDSCKNRNIYEDNCKYYISQLYARGELQCDCPEPCFEETHRTVTTYAQWPAEIHYNYLRHTFPEVLGNVSDDYLDNNVLRIEVYYEDINYLLNEQYPKYTGSKLLSDIGGIMVLWLGCTVITMAEALLLLMDLILVAFCKTRLHFQSRKAKNRPQVQHADTSQHYQMTSDYITHSSEAITEADEKGD